MTQRGTSGSLRELLREAGSEVLLVSDHLAQAMELLDATDRRGWADEVHKMVNRLREMARAISEEASG